MPLTARSGRRDRRDEPSVRRPARSRPVTLREKEAGVSARLPVSPGGAFFVPARLRGRPPPARPASRHRCLRSRGGRPPTMIPAVPPDTVYTLPLTEVVEARAHDDPALRATPGFARS